MPRGVPNKPKTDDAEGGGAAVAEKPSAPPQKRRYRFWSTKECPQQNPTVRVMLDGKPHLFEFPYEQDTVVYDENGDPEEEGDDIKRRYLLGKIYMITDEHVAAIRKVIDAPIERNEDRAVSSGVLLETTEESVGKYLRIQLAADGEQYTSLTPEIEAAQQRLLTLLDEFELIDPLDDEHAWNAKRRQIKRAKEQLQSLREQG